MEGMPPWTDRVSRLVVGAVLTACTMGVVHADPAASSCDSDNRCQALRKFFSKYESPLEKVALVFIGAADKHNLDWRLLPAIAMIETGGGKHGRKHNVFGWNSGRARFASVEAGIHFVAERLGHSPWYAGRTAMEILHRYNPARKSYPPRVALFMTELSPEPVR